MAEIVVSNLPESATEEDLLALFSQYGDVGSARVAREVLTPRSKRIAYVEMPQEHADLAVEGLNRYEFRSTELAVAPAASSRLEVGKVLNSLTDRVRTLFGRHD